MSLKQWHFCPASCTVVTPTKELIGIQTSQPSIYPQKPSGWIDVILLLAAFLLLTFDIGRYGLFEPHEGHFAGIAREMVLRGDWVTPTLNGSPYLNKPPLLYWLIAISYKAFGINELAARLPIALAAWMSVVIAWRWSRQLWGKLASRAVVMFLSVSVGWFIFAHQLLIDELLGMLLLGMMYCLWRLLQNPKSHLFFFFVYFLLGLAVLAKGILALAFWMAACGAIALTRRRWKALYLLRPLSGLGIVAAVVLPWFIAVEQANPGFIQYFLLNENFKRALDTRWPPDYSISKVSPWAYLVVALLWCLPWVLMLPPALLEIWHRWQQSGSAQSSLEDRHHHDALTLLGVLAALPILLFLPLSSRLYYYSLPALPPLAMMVGYWWTIASNGKSECSRRWVGWSMAGLGTAIATSLVWLPQSIVGFFPELAQTNGVETLVTVILIGLSVGFMGTGWCLLRKQLAIALILLWFGFGTSWACVIQGFKTIQDFRSSKTLVQTASQRLGPETRWIFEGSRELGAAGAMSFYLNPSGQPASQVLGKQKQADLSSLSKLKNTDIISIVYQSEAAYPTLYVLSDGGSNRLPPSFPGPKPKMLITKVQMQQFWNGKRPVVFVTDFLRRPNDPTDPPTLNLPKDSGQPLLEIGPRKLYGNEIARKLWLK
jgi:4-amino-4-deoxy-L-arabinose transferase-like glycosyltransferase